MGWSKMTFMRYPTYGEHRFTSSHISAQGDTHNFEQNRHECSKSLCDLRQNRQLSISNACAPLKLNISYILVRACVHSYSTVHFYKYNRYNRKYLKHCYDDRAKMLSHRIPVLLSNTISFVVKNN